MGFNAQHIEIGMADPKQDLPTLSIQEPKQDLPNLSNPWETKKSQGFLLDGKKI